MYKLLPGVPYCTALEPTINFTYLSKEIAELVGYQADEFLENCSTLYEQVFLHEDTTVLQQKIGLCDKEQRTATLAYHIRTKSGFKRLVQDHFVGDYDEDGRLTRIYGYLTPLEKESHRSQLYNQLHAYRAAIDVNIISSITDATGVIVYANTNFQKVSKYNLDELLGQTHRIVNSGHHPRSLFKDMWRTIAGGQMWRGEILNRAKDGTRYWVDTVIIPTFDNEKRIMSYLSLRMLINDRKRAEAQRERYIAVLEEIANIVAHDLRGPICSILGLVNIFKSVTCTDPDLVQGTQFLITAVNRLDQISRNLSARIYAADVELNGKSADSHLQGKQPTDAHKDFTADP